MSGNHQGNGHPQPRRQDDHAGNLVPATLGCPRCGERHADHLVWTDDETVHCTTCGTEYDPLAHHPAPEGGDDAAGRHPQ